MKKKDANKKPRNSGVQIKEERNDPNEGETGEKLVSFDNFQLDDRLRQGIANLGWSRPTLVQQEFIPLALEGKDILTRARTGSGKTAAFAIPVIQRILCGQHATSNSQHIRALVLTPTKELCEQVSRHFRLLASSASREVRVCDLCATQDVNAQKTVLSEWPEVLSGTPGRVVSHLRQGSLDLRRGLDFLVIDEADLLFSFGFEEDTKEIIKHLPTSYQCFLTSATLNDEVKSLKKLVLHNPVSLKLQEAQLPNAAQLTHYHIRCEEEDKFVLTYALIKLRLIRGKTILFVNSVDRCYRLKLFLQQFGIPCCVLNSELPVNSRCHIVSQFNEGTVDYMVASDENLGAGEDPTTSETNNEELKEKKQKRKRYRSDKESGVSRGIDFHQVSNVVNFDFPRSVESYIHRVGRTARGWNQGTALSFASKEDELIMESVKDILSQQVGGDAFKPYQFRMEELDGFKYRARDVLRSVTSTAVREARLSEIRGEILNSKRLKAYFAKNPRDLALLKHDRNLHTVRGQEHLKDVPEYIVPETLRGMNYSAPFLSRASGKKRKRGINDKPPTSGERKFQKKKNDPLTSFECDSD